MLASGLFDAVFVVTGNDSHYPITMTALNRGLHVLCEKPLALDYQQESAMAALAQEKGVIGIWDFPW